MKVSVTKYRWLFWSKFIFLLLCNFNGIAQYNILAWGDNTNGQFGNATFTGNPLPVPAATSNALPFITLAAGQGHVVGIRTDASLWTWGLNDSYQLGNGNTTASSNTPLNIYNGQWIAVAAGAQHSIAIQANGSLWGWGRNTSSQLGDGTYVPFRDVPVRTDLGTGNAWTAVSAGSYHTIALRADGSIWSWGLNNQLQLGDGTIFSDRNYPSMIKSGTPLKFTQIAAGYTHNLALAEDGSLWGWGSNSSGQLGDGSLTNRGIPFMIDAGTGNSWIQITAGENFSAGIRADGSLWTWGGAIPGIPYHPSRLPTMTFSGNCIRWKKITAGKNFIIAIKEDGSIWTCGKNEEGQLGNGTFINSTAPAQVNALNYFALNTSFAAGQGFALIAGNKINAPLVLNKPKDTSFAACILQGGTYTAGSNSVSTAGTHTFTLFTQQGCDSIIKVELSVINTVRRDSTINACDSFKFKNAVFYNNTIVRDTVQTKTGCDSIYYDIQLKIHSIPVTLLTECLPKGSIYSFGGNVLNKSGTYTTSYNNGNVCDSIVRLQLVIAADTLISVTGNGTVSWNNITFTQSTNINDTLRTTSGCDSLYRTIRIKVNPLIELYMPNSFTPNKDGLNDVFSVPAGTISSLQWFRIFNRYGELIFETNQLSRGWDGTYHGIIQPTGNYIWVLKAIDNRGKNIEARGTILMLH